MKNLLERFPGIATRYMLVAEGGVFREPTAVQTVLGSCVTVTFYSPRQRVGAMFHALMPRQVEYERGAAQEAPFKYVDSAIEACCRKLFALGVHKQDLECKIFGGASAMFKHEISIGPRNVQTAYETLAAIPLRVAASNVGGSLGRKLLFISHTGEVYVKQLKRTNEQAPPHSSAAQKKRRTL